MSNFSDAVRQMQEAEAKCPNPHCGASNEPGKPKTIRVDIHNEAWCSVCGHEWSVAK